MKNTEAKKRKNKKTVKIKKILRKSSKLPKTSLFFIVIAGFSFLIPTLYLTQSPTNESELLGADEIEIAMTPSLLGSSGSSLNRSPLEVEKNTIPPDSTRTGFGLQWIGLSHTEGKGVGYPCGYTSLEALLAPYQYSGGKFLPLIDLEVDYLNNNTVNASAGVILRYLSKNLDYAPGINVYYDVRNINSDFLHELGVGLELLTPQWDLRANGYFPVGNMPSHARTHHYPGGYVAKRTRYNQQFYGFDAEMGILLLEKKGCILYLAGGPYYLHNQFNPSVWGVQGWIQPQFEDYFALRFSVTRDSLFGTIFQGEIIISWPLYVDPPGKLSTRQVYQRTNRRNIMPSGSRCCWDSNF